MIISSAKNLATFDDIVIVTRYVWETFFSPNTTRERGNRLQTRVIHACTVVTLQELYSLGRKLHLVYVKQGRQAYSGVEFHMKSFHFPRSALLLDFLTYFHHRFHFVILELLFRLALLFHFVH